jgi:hypothetical protein
MNKFTLLSFFALLFFSAKAQDKIISIQRDTIACTIVSINNGRILYEQTNKDGTVMGKSIPLSQVAEYTASHGLTKKSTTGKQKMPQSEPTAESPFRLGLSAGLSNMPWCLDHYLSSSTLPDYYDKLKTGFHLNASAHYMIKDYWGLGVEYSFCSSSMSGNMPIEYYPSMFLLESDKCHQYIHYLGASVLFKQYLDAKRKFTVSESLSAGKSFLRMEFQSVLPSVNQSVYTDMANNTLLTGNAYSGKLGLAFEYNLCKAVSVGLGADFIWFSLKKVNYKTQGSNNSNTSVEDQELSKAMNLSRIDYSFVLHYHF